MWCTCGALVEPFGALKVHFWCVCWAWLTSITCVVTFEQKQNNCWLSFAGWNTAGNSWGIAGFRVISIMLGLKLTCLKLIWRKCASNLPVWSLNVWSLPVESVQVTYRFETFLFEAYLSKYHKWVSLISAKAKHEHWRLRFHFSNKAKLTLKTSHQMMYCRWMNCTWLHLPRSCSRSSLLPVEGKILLWDRYLFNFCFKSSGCLGLVWCHGGLQASDLREEP